jgi:hypothetical protein
MLAAKLLGVSSKKFQPTLRDYDRNAMTEKQLKSSRGIAILG